MRSKLVLVGCSTIVAASTFFLSDEPGNLTFLSLLIQLLPLLPLDLIAEPGQAEKYQAIGKLLSIVLNVLAFLSIAGLIHWILRHRAPQALPLIFLAWLLLYLSLLFVLFPVTHLEL